MLPLVVISVLWSFILNPDLGILNRFLGNIGLESWQKIWLGEQATALLSLSVISGWIFAGFYMAIFYAGFQRIPSTIIESARLDGATEWQIFRKIILPTMKPVNIIIVVITLIESLRAFDLVYIIYGSPTIFPLLNLLVFQNFAGQGISMKGAAYAVILLVLCIVPIITYLRISFKEDLRWEPV